MTTPNKRWTFNTWRLHGPKYASHAPVNPTTGRILFKIKNKIKINVYLSLEPYSSTVPTYVNPQGQFLDIDDDERLKTLLQLLRFLQMLDHEEKQQEKDNGNNQF